MTTHEKDVEFFQDNLISILKNIKDEITARHLQNHESDDYHLGLSVGYEESIGIINRYADALIRADIFISKGV